MQNILHETREALSQDFQTYNLITIKIQNKKQNMAPLATSVN